MIADQLTHDRLSPRYLDIKEMCRGVHGSARKRQATAARRRREHEARRPPKATRHSDRGLVNKLGCARAEIPARQLPLDGRTSSRPVLPRSRQKPCWEEIAQAHPLPLHDS